MATLTSANSVIMLAVAGIFPVPQQLQGYAADDAFTSPDVQPVEAVMGVDGKLSAGYTPYPTQLEITLQADSPSVSLFETWMETQETVRETFEANATISLPGTGQKYAFLKGYLTTASKMAPNRKIMQPRKWTITFESCTSSPV